MKKKVNWILVGNRECGKSTVLRAVSVVAESIGYKPQLANDDNVTTVSYETAESSISVADCADVAECAIHLGKVKGLILVVSVADGFLNYRLLQDDMGVARAFGASEMVICMNKCDCVDFPEGDELVGLVETESRELAKTGNFPGDDAPMIRCSALAAVEAPGERRNEFAQLLHVVDQLS